MVTRLTNYTKQFWILLSTDDMDTLGSHNGDEAIVIDRDERYVFDEENRIWRQIPMSGGGGGGEPSEVPDGYTQLKYVESTGAQIVNTGVTPTLDTRIEIQFYMMPGGSGFPFSTGCANPIIGVAVNSGTTGGGFSSFGNVADKTLDPPPVGGDAPIYTVSKDEATARTSPGLPVKSVAINATALGNVKPATRIGIFGRYDGDTPMRFALMRFFREKIWDGDTLLREFVPAMENATEEVGLYDIVNGVFYRNAGTGVFIGGAR